MIKKLFVSRELALKLKEVGFDEPCIKYYLTKDSTATTINGADKFLEGFNYNSIANRISVPMYQHVIDWFRENHNIMIEITLEKYHYKIELKNNLESVYRNYNFSKEYYYEALAKSIEEALELIKIKT